MIKNIFCSLFISLSLFSSHFPVDIYFVKHAKTITRPFNEPENALTPLNKEGIDQAKDLGDRFKNNIIYRVYASRTTRTRQTTSYLLDQFSKSIFPRYNHLLDEGYKGRFIYQPSQILSRLMKDFRKNHCCNRNDWVQYKVDGSVESYAEMYSRLQRFLDTVFVPQVMQENTA